MADSFKKNMNRTVKKFGSVIKLTADDLNQHSSPPDSQTAKITVKLVLAAVAAVALLAVMLGGADLSPAAIAHNAADKRMLINASGNGYPVRVEGSRAISVEEIPNGTAVLTDTNLMYFDKNGKEINSIAHYMALPVMKNGGRYSLLYDQKSLSYTLETLSGPVISGKTDDSIITGAISRSGRFALVTNYDTAFSYVLVLDKGGHVLHRWKSTNCQITSIDISPSGSYIVMSGITTDSGEATGLVIVQKVGGDSNLREYKWKGSLIFSVSFTDSHRVAAIGDNLLAYININNDKPNVFNYDNRTVTGFDIADNGNVALVLAPHSDGKNGSVLVFNQGLDRVADISTELDSPYIELAGDRVNLISGSALYSYQFNGKLARKTEIPPDVQSITTSCGQLLVKGVTTIYKVG